MVLSRKHTLLIGGTGLVLILVVFGFVIFKSHNKDQTVADNKPATKQPTSTNGLSGNQTQIPTATNSDGLNISSGSTANSSGGASQPAPGSAGSTAASTSATPTIDPSTFSQYDKYKDNQTALYADVTVGTGAVFNGGGSVYYKGWLTNGQVFDQTKTDAQGNPQAFSFTTSQVIAGWGQGLAGMKVGGTRLLIIPPGVGYGATSQGSIPANSVLVFEVQLLSTP